MNHKAIAPILICIFLTSCGSSKSDAFRANNEFTLDPIFITDQVLHDTDDPAIWINPIDASKSLIIGTDKDKDGALYVFNLEGKIIDSLVRRNLHRPNNVDIAYALNLGDTLRDIAIVTERMTHKLRVFSLPDMTPIDNGGIEVFEGETAEDFRDLMGISTYHILGTDSIYAIVGRKSGPTDSTYLWQYLLSCDSGYVTASLVRKFGAFSGKKEIESIAVDNELGFVYYSDEQVGVRKYHAHPKLGNQELALFANKGFTEDNEGISIYKTSDKTGYILVSDQGANKFQVFPREGVSGNANEHPMLVSFRVKAMESDGSEVTNVSLNSRFPNGLFVAMSADKTFHLYDWSQIEAIILNAKKS